MTETPSQVSAFSRDRQQRRHLRQAERPVPIMQHCHRHAATARWLIVIALATLIAPVAFAQTTTQQVTYTWTAPTTGSAVDHYLVQHSINGGAWVQIASVTTLSYDPGRHHRRIAPDPRGRCRRPEPTGPLVAPLGRLYPGSRRARTARQAGGHPVAWSSFRLGDVPSPPTGAARCGAGQLWGRTRKVRDQLPGSASPTRNESESQL